MEEMRSFEVIEPKEEEYARGSLDAQKFKDTRKEEKKIQSGFVDNLRGLVSPFGWCLQTLC
jgi:hypothetical protein